MNEAVPVSPQSHGKNDGFPGSPQILHISAKLRVRKMHCGRTACTIAIRKCGAIGQARIGAREINFSTRRLLRKIHAVRVPTRRQRMFAVQIERARREIARELQSPRIFRVSLKIVARGALRRYDVWKQALGFAVIASCINRGSHLEKCPAEPDLILQGHKVALGCIVAGRRQGRKHSQALVRVGPTVNQETSLKYVSRRQIQLRTEQIVARPLRVDILSSRQFFQQNEIMLNAHGV